jgi:hypothetical protein
MAPKKKKIQNMLQKFTKADEKVLLSSNEEIDAVFRLKNEFRFAGQCKAQVLRIHFSDEKQHIFLR